MNSIVRWCTKSYILSFPKLDGRSLPAKSGSYIVYVVLFVYSSSVNATKCIESVAILQSAYPALCYPTGYKYLKVVASW